MTDPQTTSKAQSLRNRVRYRFDNLLSRGTWAVLLWLGAVTVAAVLLSSLLLTAAGAEFSGSNDGSWLEDVWQSLLRAIDPGTMAEDVSWGPRLLALLITVVGILIVGTLIGLIAAGIEQRLETMQRGRSIVVESGHVVILGASARLPVVIDQLVVASIGRRANVIVVLADKKPVEMSEEVRTVVPNPMGSRLVYRFGDPTRPSDLEIVAIRKARSVIVLADEDARGDAGVVNAVLAVGAALGGFDHVPIVAEMTSPDAAATLVRACKGSVYPVVALESVARTSLFALGEPGLNQVIQELIDFRGSDMYIRDRTDLVGVPFGEIAFRFENARPIGRMRPSGEVEFNLSPDARFADGDRLVVVAEEGVPLERAPARDLAHPASPAATPYVFATEKRTEHSLVIGWNALGDQILREYQEFVIPGSTVEIVYDSRIFEPDEIDIPEIEGLEVTLTPTKKVTWQLSDMADTSALTTIMLLGYRKGVAPDAADSRTLLNLMLLRSELEEMGTPQPQVVVEVRDADNVGLARLTGADDYLVSDTIASRSIAQLAEQPDRRAVFRSLYDAAGPSVHLVPAEDLGLSGSVGIIEIVSAALAVELVAIGWRTATASGGEVRLNPAESEKLVVEPGDRIVVIG